MQDFILNCEKQFVVHMSEKGGKEECFFSTHLKNMELSCNAESTKKVVPIVYFVPVSYASF